MTLMSSSLTTQRHTNPSMVLFCVHFLYTHKYRYSRTYKQITKYFFLYPGKKCRVFGPFHIIAEIDEQYLTELSPH